MFPSRAVVSFSLVALMLCAAPDGFASDSTSLTEQKLTSRLQDLVGNPNKPLVIGGKNAKFNDHPWQVALLTASVASNRAAFFCGGSVIGAQWVLTAAHCVSDGVTSADVHVLSGTDSLIEGGTRYEVNNIYVHRAYDAKTNDSDIALLRLKKSINARSIPVVSQSEAKVIVMEGELMSISGWGYTELGRPSDQLKQVNVPIVGVKRCNDPRSYDNQVTPNMICAGYDAGGKDACKGDSGGPGVKNGRLVGVVSWGLGCAEAYKYGVYTNVGVFKEWIDACRAGLDSCDAKPGK